MLFIESDRTILNNLKPLLQQLNICGGKDGDATDTKRNMFGDNLLQVAASSTSEMQAKCALAKKSVAALLETSASISSEYLRQLSNQEQSNMDFYLKNLCYRCCNTVIHILYLHLSFEYFWV